MFSIRCKYAIRSVLYLLTKQGEKVSVKQIAADLNITQPFLAKILQDLSRAKKISSVKGIRGGFYLADDQLDNRLIDIVVAIDGEDPLQECVLGLEDCGSANPCPLHEKAVIARGYYYEVLRNSKIKDLESVIKGKGLRLS
ncbi:MAG: Rrf2 family transcriptional regulator [Bacteroidetes bacterium]|nr:Rrf2 family transcriptional regulator [Bacteroidota bacterium]